MVGCDFSEPMLDLAREKAGGRGGEGVRFEWADALSLPYDADRFDAVTVGFGVRNLADLDRGLREMARVLRPGGRLVVLEITRPRRPPFSTFYSLWFDRIVPLLGRFSDDPEAYTYLAESVRSFPAPLGLAEKMDRGRPRGDQVHDPRRRDHHDPHRHRRVTRRSAVPPPVTAVLDASSRWLPARLGEVEELLREQTRRSRRAARRRRRGDARGGRQAPAADAGPALRRARRRGRLGPRRDRDRARPHGDARPRRRPRRRAAAPRAADRVRRRPAATARSAPATCSSRAPSPCSPPPGDARSIELLADASVALARGELAQRQDAFDIAIAEQRYLERCRLKTAALFECACCSAATTRRWREFGAAIGLAFQLLDDVLDVTGPPERTGKARGTDLLDGTVTLPLIVAAGRDPAIAAIDLRGLDAGAAEALCDRIAATGALDDVRARALEMVAAAKRRLADAGLEPEQRRLLDLVADGVVQRYS